MPRSYIEEALIATAKTVNAAVNQSKKEALQSRVTATLANAPAPKTAQQRKLEINEKVQLALVAAAAMDPLKSLSCNCVAHNDFQGTPDAIIGSLVWRR